MTAKSIYSKLSGLRPQAKPAQRARPVASVLALLAEAGIHLLLGAVLAGAVLFEGCAPFGTAFVGAAGSGLYGGAALVGACFGSMTGLEFSAGLRYSSASILTFAVHFAFYDWKVLRRPWAMPLVTAGLTAATGLIVRAQAGWDLEGGLRFALEVLLTLGAVWAFQGRWPPCAGRGTGPPPPPGGWDRWPWCAPA